MKTEGYSTHKFNVLLKTSCCENEENRKGIKTLKMAKVQAKFNLQTINQFKSFIEKTVCHLYTQYLSTIFGTDLQQVFNILFILGWEIIEA